MGSNATRRRPGSDKEEEAHDHGQGQRDRGGASDSLTQTTSALGGGGSWHSVNSEVYHNNPSCQTGNSISPENVQQGMGDEAKKAEGRALQRKAEAEAEAEQRERTRQAEAEAKKAEKERDRREGKGGLLGDVSDTLPKL